MKRIDLASPVPRRKERCYNEFRYITGDKVYLRVPEELIDIPVSEVISTRRSRRTFRPISQDIVGDLLWHSARSIDVAPPSQSIRWHHRPAPSAGGRHPLDILILNQVRGSWQIALYDPLAHSRAALKLKRPVDLDRFVRHVDEVVPVGDATIIWLAAQFDRTLSKYKDGESLVWRDAGALIMMIYLVAEAFKLNCCALGITGEPLVSEVLNSTKRVVGIGGVLVGGR